MAYDWTAHRQVEEGVVGAFEGYFGWHYPPPFLLAASLLATLPYKAAFLGWAAATLALYLATMRRIVPEAPLLAAAAFPATLWNVALGQNGFLTAALLGGTLAAMKRRPAAAGLLLGLLTYKPQFGLIFPALLLATRQWRVFWAAAATALVLAGATWAVFGPAPWHAFLASLSNTNEAVLGEGMADWRKLQTAFGAARTLGAGPAAAWSAQGAVALAATVGACLVWRRGVAFEVKAAAAAVASLLATPYAYVYDLVALAVPIAFIVRLGPTRGEWTTIAGAALLVLVFPALGAPTGFIAVLAITALVLRRAGAATEIASL